MVQHRSGMDALAPIPRTGASRGGCCGCGPTSRSLSASPGATITPSRCLYERHRKSVLAVCMGVLGSRHDAEDAAQDAFAALAVSLRKGPPENLPAWLMKVARNAAIDVARRRRVDARTEEGVPNRAQGSEGGKAELESVMAGIRELPEAQRTALLMRELAGHSYREIAALLEVDEAAVHGLIARARTSLRSYREARDVMRRRPCRPRRRARRGAAAIGPCAATCGCARPAAPTSGGCAATLAPCAALCRIPRFPSRAEARSSAVSRPRAP